MAFGFFTILSFEVKAKKEQELQEKIFIEEMDEETYNKLPLERRKEIDQKLLETKKQRLKKCDDFASKLTWDFV